MPAALVLDDEALDDLEEFASALTAVGLQAWRSTLGAARTFLGRVERAGGWDHVALGTQLEWMRRARPFVSWLLVTGRLTASADFLALADLRLGLTARKHLPDLHTWFAAAAQRVGVPSEDVALQWNALCKVAALSGTRPDEVDTDLFFAARAEIYDAYTRRGRPAHPGPRRRRPRRRAHRHLRGSRSPHERGLTVARSATRPAATAGRQIARFSLFPEDAAPALVAFVDGDEPSGLGSGHGECLVDALGKSEGRPYGAR